jgi:hypothetical protein
VEAAFQRRSGFGWHYGKEGGWADFEEDELLSSSEESGLEIRSKRAEAKGD